MIEEIVERIAIEENINKITDNIVDKTYKGLTGVIKAGIGNYIKRRNVGFNFKQSVKGSWKETTNNIKADFCGREQKIYKEAIIFEDHR